MELSTKNQPFCLSKEKYEKAKLTNVKKKTKISKYFLLTNIKK
jgi:hypothetical protein